MIFVFSKARGTLDVAMLYITSCNDLERETFYKKKVERERKIEIKPAVENYKRTKVERERKTVKEA